METLKQLVVIIGGFAGIIGLFVGLYQYNRQQKFKRLQNLSSVWQKFITNDDLLELYTMLDSGDYTSLSNFSTRTKLKFLALLEEVSLYVEEFEVDKAQAVYLFQWHFYSVFNDEQTKESFWNNMGGIEEAEKDYWKKSKIFAQSCYPEK